MRPLLAGLALAALVPVTAAAAELPPHGPLRILIVSDEVNPNNLSDAQLTQPGDISAALVKPGSGLNLAPGPDSVLEVSSQCVDEALAALAPPSTYDVLIYFAHKPARGCDNMDRQVAFTAGVEALLVGGGGVVVFHHGIYQAAGKEAILQLLGGSASAIQWDTNAGQRVLDVAPGHFVTTNSVEYTGKAMYADPQSGVPAGSYDLFTNVPDERYPALALLTAPGETREILFASDYATGGGTHVLGYDLQRLGWAGRVVHYQPGEYQPNALDDLAGNNFQILANAIVHVAPVGGGDTTGGDTTGGDTSGGMGGSTGEVSTSGPGTSGPSTSGPATTSDSGPNTTAPATSGATATGDAPTSSDATSSVTASGGDGSSGGVASDGSGTGGAGTKEEGCACAARSAGGPAGGWLLLALGGLVRRRRGAR